MADLRMYLTSLEPDISQSILSQSIGGFISNTPLYPEAVLDSIVGLYDTSFVLKSPSSGSWAEWEGITHISINGELMRIGSLADGAVTVAQRGVNDRIRVHVVNDIATGVSLKELFNDVFNDEYKQYRCIAVKNVSSGADPSNETTANNLRIYVDVNSRNSGSNIKVAIEIPQSQYIAGIADSVTYNSSTSIPTLVDTSLINVYENNLFNGSYLKILSGENAGQGRIIRSFSSSTGIFVFEGVFTADANASYEVFPAPAQRLKNGTISPVINSNTGSFLKSSNLNKLSVELNLGQNISGDSGALDINNIFYLWIEKTVTKGEPSFDNNSVSINIDYNSVIG